MKRSSIKATDESFGVARTVDKIFAHLLVIKLHSKLIQVCFLRINLFIFFDFQNEHKSCQQSAVHNSIVQNYLFWRINFYFVHRFKFNLLFALLLSIEFRIRNSQSVLVRACATLSASLTDRT